MKLCYIQISPFLNNPKYLDLSYKMDLEFWIVLEGKLLHLHQEWAVGLGMHHFIL